MRLTAENMYTQHHASVSPSHQEITGAVPVFPGPPADAPRGRTVLTDVVTVSPAYITGICEKFSVLRLVIKVAMTSD